MDKIVSQTYESMKRNLSHQTRHARKSKEIQNTCDILLTCLEWHIDPFYMSFPDHSIILEWPRVGHSFSFFGKKRFLRNLIVLKQNYCSLACQRKKQRNGGIVGEAVWYISQPHWMAHRHYPNLKMDIDGWMDGWMRYIYILAGCVFVVAK